MAMYVRRRNWFLRFVFFFWALYLGAFFLSHLSPAVAFLVVVGVVAAVVWLVMAALRR